MTSFDNIKESDLNKLKRYNYLIEKPKSKQEIARAIGNATLVLYKTGKLLIQGRKEHVDDAVKLLKFLGLEKRGISAPAVGSDEALKGDTFGGIVVAGFLADDTIRDDLRQMNVKDSKKLYNPDVVRIATEIIAKYPDKYHIESILPKEFNKLNEKNNMTYILDLLHEKCYRKLAGKSKIIHIVDEYPGCGVGNIREKYAESKFLEVAAASIIARYGALIQIRELEKMAGFFIPLGSTHVTSALLEIKKKTLSPENFVKLKFKNVLEFF